MEFGDGIEYILILIVMSWLPLIALSVLVGAAIVFLNKQLSQSSWFRKILAVVTGLIIDLGITYIVIGIYTTILFYSEASVSITPSILISVFTFLLAILGGYIAGKIARQNEVIYGLATGIGILLISVLMSLSTKTHGPAWQLSLDLAMNIGSTTLGGYFAFIQRKRNQAKLPEIPQAS